MMMSTTSVEWGGVEESNRFVRRTPATYPRAQMQRRLIRAGTRTSNGEATAFGGRYDDACRFPLSWTAGLKTCAWNYQEYRGRRTENGRKGKTCRRDRLRASAGIKRPAEASEW